MGFCNNNTSLCDTFRNPQHRHEPKPHLAVIVLIGLEKEGVALYRAEHFAAAGKAKLPVELAGVVEAEDAFGLLGEEIFGFGEEFEEGVALDNVFDVGEAAGFVLDKVLLSGTCFETLGKNAKGCEGVPGNSEELRRPRPWEE
ncbi:hypothetical protein F0562_035284 [Nyssa sinensis]|uniref:Uncharacterized protein n=1 Tax=Nyssa sinensis TaxID=561372 RepID=A0A5J5AEI6_9ASTE|nr:hypothetical protein F0562_035284 [Nyssa sinensis]